MAGNGEVKRKQKIVQFGKYKGWDMQTVLETDPGYARWALNTLAIDARPNQRDFLAYIKVHLVDDLDYTQDLLLKDAWYLDPQAWVLTDHELDPELCAFLETPAIVYCKVEAISVEEYRSMLDQDLLRQYVDEINPKTDFIVHFSTGAYFLKPEIVNAAMALRNKYRQNQKADEPHILAGTPSKVITRYWLHGTQMMRNISTGKWTLFFDKTKENVDGLTDLDVCYRLLREKSSSIAGLSSFKVSTRRPNSNGADSQKGVAVVYCDEEHRVDVLLQLATLLSLKNGKYYWKYHSQRYAKDGMKASDYCYTLNNN